MALPQTCKIRQHINYIVIRHIVRHLSTCFRDPFEALKPGHISNYLPTPAHMNGDTDRQLKCEDYLHQVTNTRHRIALTKLRLSNHKLAIETGRRPFKKPAERNCPICKIEMEDEYHFLNRCPAYQEKRCSLLDYLEKEYKIKISRMSPNRIFMFLVNPPSGNVRIQKLIAKHVFHCFEKRKEEDGKSKYCRT